MNFLSSIEFWHWWVAALALGIAEMLAPGFFLLWLGVAATLVGLLLLIAPELAWEWQLAIFAVLSVASVVGWRYWAAKHPAQSDQPTLNRRAEQLVGRVLSLDEGIVNGRGFVKVDDSRWKVEGEDLPAGSKVRVTGVDGTILKVERA